MGIDGIGKRPPVTGGEGVGGTGASGVNGPERASNATGATFDAHVGEAGKTDAAHVTSAVSESSPLAEVRAGRITLNEYLDRKVDEATAHVGPLSSSQRAFMKDALRTQMATDPALADLVQRATGHVPEPPES